MSLLTGIEHFVQTINHNSISPARKELLTSLAEFIQQKKNAGADITLNFICTHNSRRSHLGQIWAQTMAHYFNVGNVFCYSGGTEATALFPKIAETLKHVGFEIEQLSQESNPVYAIKFAQNSHPIIGFSKVMDHPFNPASDFGAIMTCSQADEGCPFVPGAEKRIPITYEDPKVSDNGPNQSTVYAERSLQIATEMHFVFSLIG